MAENRNYTILTPKSSSIQFENRHCVGKVEFNFFVEKREKKINSESLNNTYSASMTRNEIDCTPL